MPQGLPAEPGWPPGPSFQRGLLTRLSHKGSSSESRGGSTETLMHPGLALLRNPAQRFPRYSPGAGQEGVHGRRCQVLAWRRLPVASRKVSGGAPAWEPWGPGGGRAGGLSSAGGVPGHLGCCGQTEGRGVSEPPVPEGAGSQGRGGFWCLAAGAVAEPGLGPSTARGLVGDQEAASIAAWPQAGLAGEQPGRGEPHSAGVLWGPGCLGPGTAHSFAPDGPPPAAPRRSGDSGSFLSLNPISRPQEPGWGSQAGWVGQGAGAGREKPAASPSGK